ncbi:unnamed protein product [Ilex paraguariensis]|uniref:Uncharacterized protein n=1 Tax=Ilex paraguariensis TaxID=185542 RepID=A0ABC8UB52_9AQUA
MFIGSSWLHAPPLRCSYFTTISPASSQLNNNNHLPMSTSVRIAVVGDVHDDWNLEEDAKALQFLQVNIFLHIFSASHFSGTDFSELSDM